MDTQPLLPENALVHDEGVVRISVREGRNRAYTLPLDATRYRSREKLITQSRQDYRRPREKVGRNVARIIWTPTVIGRWVPRVFVEVGRGACFCP